MSYKDRLAAAIVDLDEVVDRLLDPETGCPWDIKQTPQSVRGNVLEECYELIEALGENSPADIREEAGDVLFQAAFIGRLAQSRWNYGLAEIIEGVTAKMVSRHPHVFGTGRRLDDAQAVLDQWQTIKRRDKKHEPLLASVPPALPALQRAHRLGERAGRAGFDRLDPAQARARAAGAMAELDGLLPDYDPETAAPELKAQAKHVLGETLSALAALGRGLGFSAEEALSEANRRFVERFNDFEKRHSNED
ncbi:MAG: MazG family protein [Candidatus Adiutrix sp.]|jgi:MazG family protein|nr:MazG family protein [Candidatus Adiutrix sp.]